MATESRLQPVTPRWKDEYLTGIPVIDEQHQHFFVFVTELLQRVREGVKPDDQHKALEELVNYACYHFTTEEEWMQLHGYPESEFKAHCVEHAGFVQDVKKLRQRMYDGEEIFADLLVFASEWLVRHITRTDFKYAQFARQVRGG